MTVAEESAVRSLVLNGLTVTAVVPSQSHSDPGTDSLSGDFYHELEIYHKLLRGDPDCRETEVECERRPRSRRTRSKTTDSCRTTDRGNDGEDRRSKTLAPLARTSPRSSPGTPSARSLPATPSPKVFKAESRPAQYMGSFPVNGMDQIVRAEFVTSQLHQMKETGRAVPVLVVISLAGVKICRPEDSGVRMAHALRRISYATCEPAHALFAFVAREPRGPPATQYCHSFTTDTAKQAEELNALVGNAFRMAFATQLQPGAPATRNSPHAHHKQSPHKHWNKELSSSGTSGSEKSAMGVRAPNSIPGLTHQYPHNNLFPNRGSNCDGATGGNTMCGVGGVVGVGVSASPSGSEESNSPTQLNWRWRLSDKPPLMKRLAAGLTGALQPTTNDDSTPLVPLTTHTPNNRPISLNGGYVNEAISESDIKAAIKDAAKEKGSSENINNAGDIPVKHIHIDSVNINNQMPIIDKTMPTNFDTDFIKKHNNVKNSIQSFHSMKNSSSRAPSSSSGSSCCGNTNNMNSNNCNHSNFVVGAHGKYLGARRDEADLRLAPWFQAGIPREIALEVLANQPIGAFMVRSSTTKLGCFALSLRVPRDFQPSGIAHYLILRTIKGYKIKGFTKEFTSLTSLITHHSVMPELLPCPLSLSRYNPSYARSEDTKDFEDIDNDPDYNTLADFRKMMADLNV